MIDGKQRIDRTVPIPLYYQLKNIILTELKNGSYKPGDLIPTENEISEMYNLSRTTVRQTISELVQEGWVYRVKSKGTFVGKPKSKAKYILEMESISGRIRSLGMTPSTEVRTLEVQTAEKLDAEVLDTLKLSKEDKVIFADTLWSGDGGPIAAASTYMPYSSCNHILGHDLSNEPLLSVLAQKDATRVCRIERTARAAAPLPEDQKELKLKKEIPVFLYRSVGYNTLDAPVEYSIVRFHGDKYQFKATVYPED